MSENGFSGSLQEQTEKLRLAPPCESDSAEEYAAKILMDDNPDMSLEEANRYARQRFWDTP